MFDLTKENECNELISSAMSNKIRVIKTFNSNKEQSMISKLKSFVAGLTLAIAGTATAIPVIQDCDQITTDGLEAGLTFMAANWNEYEQRIQDGGVEIADCLKKAVFEKGKIACDRVECPMPGMISWTYSGIGYNQGNFCPWYIEERIEHLRTVDERGACLTSSALNILAISCKDIDSEHWDYYSAIAFEMIKEANPNLKRLDGMVDCGQNRGAPILDFNGNGKAYQM
ncbi:hypothetical protein N9W79_00275 [bacterium]|nr:hypothetical protein [bacterium]